MKKKMYKFIFSVFLLVSLGSNAQTVDGKLYTKFNNFYSWRGGLFDSVLNIPSLQATSGKRSGAMYYNTSDSSIYVWTGFQWRQLGAGGGGGSYTSSNGITLSGSDFKLGGDLTGATTIQAQGNNFQIRSFSGNEGFAIFPNSSTLKSRIWADGSGGAFHLLGTDTGRVFSYATDPTGVFSSRIVTSQYGIFLNTRNGLYLKDRSSTYFSTTGSGSAYTQTATDTTTFKPLVLNTSTGLVSRMTSWPTGGGSVTSATGTGTSLVNGSSQIKRLKEGLGIKLTDNTDSVKIESNNFGINIEDYGGKGDSTVNNAVALAAAKAAYPNSVIYFPNRGFSKYYFNNTSSTLFDSVTLYVEEGAKFYLTTENTSNFKSLTPVIIYQLSLNNQDQYTYATNPNTDHVAYESITDNVVVRTPILADSFVERGTTSWARTTGEPIASVPGNLTVVNSKEISLTATSGQIRVATLTPVQGQTISATARYSNSNEFPVLYVENSWGYAIYYGSNILQIRKFGDPNDAIGEVTMNDELDSNGVYLNYKVNRAVSSIKLAEDGINFEFQQNGVNRLGGQFNLGGLAITKWGFGVYGPSGSSTVSWYDFISEMNKKPSASLDEVVQIYGDSQTPYFLGDTWMNHFTNYVNNSYCFRINKLESYAVSGHTISQQKAIFDTVYHKGTTIFFAGTNDIQSQSTISTILTNLTSMVTALNYTNNLNSATVGTLIQGKKRFILVIPPMFFSYALNGNKGKASTNYELGGAYRMALLRWAAENGIMVVDLPATWGATNRDSKLMRDDIHPSFIGNSVTGMEIAKKYIALKTGASAPSAASLKTINSQSLSGSGNISVQPTLVSGTNIKTINGIDVLGSGDIGITGAINFINLDSNFSSSSSTLADVTGWNFSVTSGKTYRIQVIAGYQSSATNTGGTMGIALSGGAVGTVRGIMQAAITTTTTAGNLQTVIRTTSGSGSSLTSTAVGTIDVPHYFTMDITFTCTTSGTFSIQWATENGGFAAQLNANSSLIYQVLN